MVVGSRLVPLDCILDVPGEEKELAHMHLEWVEWNHVEKAWVVGKECQRFVSE